MNQANEENLTYHKEADAYSTYTKARLKNIADNLNESHISLADSYQKLNINIDKEKAKVDKEGGKLHKNIMQLQKEENEQMIYLKDQINHSNVYVESRVFGMASNAQTATSNVFKSYQNLSNVRQIMGYDSRSNIITASQFVLERGKNRDVTIDTIQNQLAYLRSKINEDILPNYLQSSKMLIDVNNMIGNIRDFNTEVSSASNELNWLNPDLLEQKNSENEAASNQLSIATITVDGHISSMKSTIESNVLQKANELDTFVRSNLLFAQSNLSNQIQTNVVSPLKTRLTSSFTSINDEIELKRMQWSNIMVNAQSNVMKNGLFSSNLIEKKKQDIELKLESKIAQLAGTKGSLMSNAQFGNALDASAPVHRYLASNVANGHSNIRAETIRLHRNNNTMSEINLDILQRTSNITDIIDKPYVSSNTLNFVPKEALFVGGASLRGSNQNININANVNLRTTTLEVITPDKTPVTINIGSFQSGVDSLQQKYDNLLASSNASNMMAAKSQGNHKHDDYILQSEYSPIVTNFTSQINYTIPISMANSNLPSSAIQQLKFESINFKDATSNSPGISRLQGKTLNVASLSNVSSSNIDFKRREAIPVNRIDIPYGQSPFSWRKIDIGKDILASDIEIGANTVPFSNLNTSSEVKYNFSRVQNPSEGPNAKKYTYNDEISHSNVNFAPGVTSDINVKSFQGFLRERIDVGNTSYIYPYTPFSEIMKN